MENRGEITVFAKTNFRHKEVPFGIKRDDRRRHMYVLGKTGMGKTSLLENLVIQDIRNGHGVAFLDPHGDSVQRILDCVPSSRVNDVVYFNPADLEYPLAFNILEAVDTKYKHLVASGLMGVFTKIWANLWSARMEYILNNTILALLDSPGNTLLGITRMYVDKKYRKKIVDNVKDPMVRAFWVDEFANYNEKYRTEAIAPIQNKVGQFLSSGIIRNIVGQPKSTIDLRDIMDNQKILIMDLSKGKVGEDNSALLGAMIVTKLQLAAMSRTDIPEHERQDFYLYVDEFQNFATESFATILSEARKYRLNLIVGHQYIAQLEQDKNTKVGDAIFGNVGTMVIFRVGAADAEFLETEFDPIFTPNDLVNLPKYNIILKLMTNGVASEPFSASTMLYSSDWVTHNAEKVIKVSRERYANPVAEVEEKISRWMGSDFHQELAGVAVNSPEQPVTVSQTAYPDKEFIDQKPHISEQTVEVLPTVPAPQGVTQEAPKATISPTMVDFTTLGSTSHTQPDDTDDDHIAKEPAPFMGRQNASVQQGAQPQRNSNRDRDDGFSRQQRDGEGHRGDRRLDSRNQYSNRRGGGGKPGQRNGNNFRNEVRNKPKPAQKRDNPIWETVASIRNEKVYATLNVISEVVKNSVQTGSQEIIRENQLKQPAHSLPQNASVSELEKGFAVHEKLENLKSNVSKQSSDQGFQHSTPMPPPPIPFSRKVLKPGQSSKS